MWTRFMDMHSGGRTKVVRLKGGTFIDGDNYTKKGQPIDYIYIEAPIHEAKLVFYNRFSHNPERVSCTCCGGDYSISEGENLAQLTAFNRHCAYDETLKAYVERQDESLRQYVAGAEDDEVWRAYLNQRGNAVKHITLEDYMKLPDVLFIPATHIKPEERRGEVPEQGYVWV